MFLLPDLLRFGLHVAHAALGRCACWAARRGQVHLHAESRTHGEVIFAGEAGQQIGQALLHRKRATASPDPLDAVIIEGLVSADDGQLFDQGLRDDQSIEGITVMEGHDRNLADVGDIDRQQGHAIIL